MMTQSIIYLDVSICMYIDIEIFVGLYTGHVESLYKSNFNNLVLINLPVCNFTHPTGIQRFRK